MIVNGRDIKRNNATAADVANAASALIAEVLEQAGEHRTMLTINRQRFTPAELLVAHRVLARLAGACDG